MKKLFLSSIGLLLSIFLISCAVSAQKNTDATVANSQLFKPEATFSDSPVESSKTGADIKDVHARALKNFNRDYKNAVNARWNISDKTITASFTENGIAQTVVYLKNGRWLHTLLRYDESRLPEHVRSIIKDNFRYFNITWITEVHEADKVLYFVNIENEKRFKQVVVCNDEFGIYKDLRKAN